MTIYLFSDIFNNFKVRFFAGKEGGTNNNGDDDLYEFLYDISFGFMPRRFDLTDEDKIIYDEEQEVWEMYFIMEGCVGIGYSLISNGYTGE